MYVFESMWQTVDVAHFMIYITFYLRAVENLGNLRTVCLRTKVQTRERKSANHYSMAFEV
jgi:hypothetical protein